LPQYCASALAGLADEFAFAFSAFALELVNGLSLVNYTACAERSLPGAGAFRTAGQLAHRHIDLPVRMVALG